MNERGREKEGESRESMVTVVLCMFMCFHVHLVVASLFQLSVLVLWCLLLCHLYCFSFVMICV